MSLNQHLIQNKCICVRPFRSIDDFKCPFPGNRLPFVNPSHCNASHLCLISYTNDYRFVYTRSPSAQSMKKSHHHLLYRIQNRKNVSFQKSLSFCYLHETYTKLGKKIVISLWTSEIDTRGKQCSPGLKAQPLKIQQFIVKVVTTSLHRHDLKQQWVLFHVWPLQDHVFRYCFVPFCQISQSN